MHGVLKRVQSGVWVWLLAAMLQMGSACAAENVTYYVDPAGNDNNPGTLSQPFKTIKKAVATLGTSIGTVYLRGGFYPPETSIVRLTLDKSGVPGNWIKIWAYNDERPIIDFTGGTSVWPNGTEGFRVLGSYYHLKGLTIQNATGWGIVLHGSNNIVENCVSRNNHGTGIKIINTTADMGGGVIQSFVPANNLIVNSDAIGNHSVGDGGDNADGISVAYTIGPGNILRGNRAWNNGDDGFDLWMASAPVLIENNYAFGNGVNRWAEPGLWRGNGDGFKLGGGGVNTAHIVRNNLAFDNGTPGATAGNGFDQNSNHGGIQLYNNLAVCLMHQGRFEEAEHIALNAVSLAQQKSAKKWGAVQGLPLCTLGSILILQNRLDEAKERLDEAHPYVLDDPGRGSVRPAYHMYRALLDTRQDDIDASLAVFKDLMDIKESNPHCVTTLAIMPLYLLANEYMNAKRYQAAEQALHTAYAVAKQNPVHPVSIRLRSFCEKYLLLTNRQSEVADMHSWLWESPKDIPQLTQEGGKQK